MRVDSGSGFVHRMYCGIATFFARETHGSGNGLEVPCTTKGSKDMSEHCIPLLILHGSLTINNNCIMLYFSNDLAISQF